MVIHRLDHSLLKKTSFSIHFIQVLKEIENTSFEGFKNEKFLIRRINIFHAILNKVLNNRTFISGKREDIIRCKYQSNWYSYVQGLIIR